MSLLVLGLSHHNAPLDLLERISLDVPGRRALAHAIAGSEHVREVVIVSTCNRTEVYAEAATFHGAIADITDGLSRQAGLPRADLTERLGVHYEDGAIAHTFRVASGLDSMALGESQIRAQLRSSLHEAQTAGLTGASLNQLFQQALRVGKRVHSETGIETYSSSLVETAYAAAAPIVGPLAEARLVVVGAGAMAALVATTATRAGFGSITIANRTYARGEALAFRVGGRAIHLAALPEALAAADVVVSCVGSPGLVVTAGDVAAARAGREGAAAEGGRDPARSQVYVDLAMPHDIEYAVQDLPGVTRLGLDHLGGRLRAASGNPVVRAATRMVDAEVAEFIAGRSAQAAVPTIAAIRERGAAILAAELTRLRTRTPHLQDAERREVEIAMGRLVDKLLHGPTVRVKELAASGRMAEYADALAELFAPAPAAESGAVTLPSVAYDRPNEIAATEVASTEVAATEVASTEIAATESASTEVESSGRSAGQSPPAEVAAPALARTEGVAAPALARTEGVAGDAVAAEREAS